MRKDAVTPSKKTTLPSQDPFIVVGRRRHCWSLSAPVSGTAITLTPPLLSKTTTTKSTETDRGLCLRLPPMMSQGTRGASNATSGDNNWRGAGDLASVCWRRAHQEDNPCQPLAEDPLSSLSGLDKDGHKDSNNGMALGIGSGGGGGGQRSGHTTTSHRRERWRRAGSGLQNKHNKEDCATAAAATTAGNAYPIHRKGGRKRRLQSGRWL